VALALTFDTDLATAIARQPEGDEALSRKLWLAIARHLVAGGEGGAPKVRGGRQAHGARVGAPEPGNASVTRPAEQGSASSALRPDPAIYPLCRFAAACPTARSHMPSPYRQSLSPNKHTHTHTHRHAPHCSPSALRR
jgi:hypothetical protein